jgi:cleavage stimulation factor subunit 3
MTARTALREMRGLTDILPFPIIPAMPQFTELDRRIVAGWRAFIKWEESNPLNTDDESLVVQRVSYALKKCMAQMRHFPELWHYAASYHLSNGRAEEGAAFLKCGVAACPKSFLLTFALAETEEDRKNYAECHSIFQALIKNLDTEIEELTATVAAEVEVARGPEIPIASAMEFDTGDDSDIGRLVREREDRGKLVQERRGKDIDEVKTATGVVWVMYMRFARRAEGLKAARLVFGKARKSPNPTWHIFEASALMEYHSNKDQAVAVRIFEFGLKLFSEDVHFVMSYLNFLLSINDDTSELMSCY